MGPKDRIGPLGILEEIFFKIEQWNCEDSRKMYRVLQKNARG